MSDGDKPTRPRATVAFIVVFLALIVGAALMEGTVRLYAGLDRRFGNGLREFDPMAVQIEPLGEHGFRQKPNGMFHYQNGVTVTANSRGYRGPLVPDQHAAESVRIILFGGSTTHGWGVVDSQTIDAHMREILRDRRPNTTFEVVNMGLDGYDMFQILQRLQYDGLAMHPTLIVVNEGINDVRNALLKNLKDEDPRTLVWQTVIDRLREERARGRPTLWTLAKHYLYVARAPGYVRQQIEVRNDLKQRRALGQTNASARATRPDSGGPPYPEAAELFELNVRRIVSLAHENGIPVLLSTPPSALSMYPEMATSERAYWVIDAKHTQAYRDELARRMAKVASEEQAAGHPVPYVHPDIHELPLYLDDCHLASGGNRIVAETWVRAILPLLDDRGASNQSIVTSHAK